MLFNIGTLFLILMVPVISMLISVLSRELYQLFHRY